MTPEQIAQLIELALTNGYTISQVDEDTFNRIDDEGNVVGTIGLESLSRLAGLPDLPGWWPSDLTYAWPPTYLDNMGNTQFDINLYYDIKDRVDAEKQQEEEQAQTYSSFVEADAAARAATEASRGAGRLPGEQGVVSQRWEAVGLPGGGYTIQPVEAEAPAEPEAPREEFIDSVDEGGWQIDQYGYRDPDTGELVVTRRQPRQAIKDPIRSMDDMIAMALSADDIDWSDPDDPNLQRAQRLFDFKNQPTDAERLRLAMDFAQSPSDYMTLVGLYTGAVSRESPARWGERIAPLAPFLQQAAQRFFLTDVPGVSDEPPPGDTTVEDRSRLRMDRPPVDTEQDRQQVEAIVDIVPETAAAQDITEAPRQFDRPMTGERFVPKDITTPGFLDEDRGASDIPLTAPGDFPELTDWRATTPSPDPIRIPGEMRGQGGFSDRNVTTEDDNIIYDFQQGGVVPGMPGEPRLIRAEGGEIVIPNSIRGEHMLQPFGVWRPPADVFAREVTRPFTRALLPTHKVPGIRFRSPQTIRRMTPTQRAAFQANVEQEFGVPWEDWSMQERMSTDIGGPRRQRAQFRRPSFVRG